jgi:excisionase family DNA binding protein
MPRGTSKPKPHRGPERAPVGLLLSEAAALLEVSPSTIRRYVKGGKLKASRVAGKYGAEYRIHPSVLKAFALEALGIVLAEEDLEGVKAHTYMHGTPPPSEDVTELYERLIALTEEATRYKALSEVSESTRREAEEHYRAQIAELQYEKKLLEETVQTLETRKGWRPWRRG